MVDSPAVSVSSDRDNNPLISTVTTQSSQDAIIVNGNNININTDGDSIVPNQAQEGVIKDDEGKKKRRTSKVWEAFNIITLKDGSKKVQCNYCNAKMAHQSTGSTTHLKRHMDSCTVRLASISGKSQQVLSYPTLEPEGKVSNLTSYKYDKEKVRDILAKMIIVHESPFRMIEHEFFVLLLKTLNPKFEPMSRMTLRNDCMKIYALEKNKVQATLSNVERISLTSDLWTSNQNIGYMCLTGHFLDSEWRLQKKVLNFCQMPPPHSGLMISDTIFACLNEWKISNKISTITLDNASVNDVAAKHLIDSFMLKGSSYFGGKIFQVRCCAHVINLLVKDGLAIIDSFISKVRESVKYLKSSPARMHRFYEIANQLQLPTTKKLVLDVATRWNSTYAMLESAIKFKDVFPRYANRDSSYHSLPSYNDWEKAYKVMEFLEVFSEATNVFSGHEYPTSNLFLPEVWKIKELLNYAINDGCDYMQKMACQMKGKFDKYWGECNLLMAIASVLDPRNKMQLIVFCFPKIYVKTGDSDRNIQKVKDSLYELYKNYVDVENCKLPDSSTLQVGSSNTSSSSIKKGKTRSRAEFDTWAQGFDNVYTLKSDLDVYLEEGRLIDNNDDKFDVLQWWKANVLKFRILSKMAKDILSIPITTVASESTFSAGGRILDPYRSSLNPETVQALICSSDWIRNDYKLGNYASFAAHLVDEEGLEDRKS